MDQLGIMHGIEQTGRTILPPDIAEQVEIAKRMQRFISDAQERSTSPSLRTRVTKDYRSPQPNGIAQVSVAYSEEYGGRLSTEVHASHKSTGIEAHYALIANGEAWQRIVGTPKNGQSEAIIDHDNMLHDMLEYIGRNGETAKLLDKVVSARALAKALLADTYLKSHYKAGSDVYVTTVPTFSQDGYGSARRIELHDSRVNHLVQRKLAVSALTNFSDAPVDIYQTLAYTVKYRRNGAIKEDGISLDLTSKDGLSAHTLETIGQGSDAIPRRIDIFNDGLNVLETTLLTSD